MPSVATRMGMDEQKLTQILVSNGASEDTLKRRLRAQIGLDQSCTRTLQGQSGNQG